MPRVGVLSSRLPASGNRTTADRIIAHLTSNDVRENWNVFAIDSAETAQAFGEPLGPADALLGVHLLHTGKWLQKQGYMDLDSNYHENESPKLVVVLGGTDVNRCAHVPDQKRILSAVLQRSFAVVALHEDQIAQFEQILDWTRYREKVRLIRPSASVFRAVAPSSSSCSGGSGSPSTTSPCSGEVASSDSLLQRLLRGELPFFLMVAGLRPVKNPLYLIERMGRWHEALLNPGTDETPALSTAPCLVIVGASYPDFAAYAEQVQVAIAQANSNTRDLFPAVVMVDAMPQEQLHVLMSKCIAVISSSDAEGLPNAIVEALMLRVPVVARSCTGNDSLVKNEETGLVFRSPDEFVAQASRLLPSAPDSAALRERLTQVGGNFIDREFNFDSEGCGFRKVVQECLAYTP